MLHVNQITLHSHSIISMVLMKSLRRGELEDIFIVLNVCFGRTGRRKNQFLFWLQYGLKYNLCFLNLYNAMQLCLHAFLTQFLKYATSCSKTSSPQKWLFSFHQLSTAMITQHPISLKSVKTLTMTPPWCENVRTCAESAQLSSAVSKGSHDPTVSTGELATQQSRDSNRGQNNTASL